MAIEQVREMIGSLMGESKEKWSLDTIEGYFTKALDLVLADHGLARQGGYVWSGDGFSVELFKKLHKATGRKIFDRVVITAGENAKDQQLPPPSKAVNQKYYLDRLQVLKDYIFQSLISDEIGEDVEEDGDVLGESGTNSRALRDELLGEGGSKGVSKFKVGDKVRVTMKGMQWGARQVPAHMGYTREHKAYRMKLSKLREKGTIGTVERVFPSGSMNVEFGKNMFDIKPQMVELVKNEDVDSDEDPLDEMTKLVLRKTPAGTWGFAGKVPVRLAYQRADGKPLTREDESELSDLIDHSVPRSGKGWKKYKKRIFKSEEAARSAAKKGGFKFQEDVELDEAREGGVVQNVRQALKMMKAGASDKEVLVALKKLGADYKQAHFYLKRAKLQKEDVELDESPIHSMRDELLGGGLEEGSVEGAENAIRDMFTGQHYKGRVPQADIKRVLSGKQWHRLHGKSNVERAWKGLIKDKYVVLKKGVWVWESTKDEDVELDERKLSVPETHQKKIALKTLGMSKSGALVMGGMNHQEAVSFLKKIGYSVSKIKRLLKNAQHSDGDIKGFVREDVELDEAGSVRTDQKVQRVFNLIEHELAIEMRKRAGVVMPRDFSIEGEGKYQLERFYKFYHKGEAHVPGKKAIFVAFAKVRSDKKGNPARIIVNTGRQDDNFEPGQEKQVAVSIAKIAEKKYSKKESVVDAVTLRDELLGNS